MEEPYAYRWRHELRVGLLEGRIALLAATRCRRSTLHERLIATATERYAPRYAQLGEVIRLQARAALEAEPPAADALAELSSSLSAVAGVEAWWVMAELGAALGSDVCFELAAAHRDRLADHLDPVRSGGVSRLRRNATREHEDARPYRLTAIANCGDGAGDELVAPRVGQRRDEGRDVRQPGAIRGDGLGLVEPGVDDDVGDRRCPQGPRTPRSAEQRRRVR